MDFYELCAATIIAKFDDARAEKLKTMKLPQYSLFNFSQNVDNPQRK